MSHVSTVDVLGLEAYIQVDCKCELFKETKHTNVRISSYGNLSDPSLPAYFYDDKIKWLLIIVNEHCTMLTYLPIEVQQDM